MTRVKSFFELKRKGKAKTVKPEVRKVSIWLDDVLRNYKNFPQFKERKDGLKTLFIRVSTKNGSITILLKPHKLFFRYLNKGWRLKACIKLQLDFQRKIVQAYFTFQKTVKIPKAYTNALASDYNLNNVTLGDYNTIFQVKTELGEVVEKYPKASQLIQQKYLVGWKRKILTKRVKNW